MNYNETKPTPRSSGPKLGRVHLPCAVDECAKSLSDQITFNPMSKRVDGDVVRDSIAIPVVIANAAGY